MDGQKLVQEQAALIRHLQARIAELEAELAAIKRIAAWLPPIPIRQKRQ